MWYRAYGSKHPHQVHQLLVSPSRHLWIKKTGEVAYQKKPFQLGKRDLEINREKLLLRYVIRDHHTKVFYCEYSRYTEPLNIIEFLHRSWMPKIGLEKPPVFCGIPSFLMVPENLWSDDVAEFLQKVQVKPLKPPSGFASGMRIFRELDNFERQLLFWSSHERPTVDSLEYLVNKFMDDYNTATPIDRHGISPWEALQRYFEECPPMFPPPIEKISGKTLPPLPTERIQLKIRDSIQAWLITEYLRRKGDEPTYQDFLSELAESEVWPVLERWGDYTPYEKFQSDEEKRRLTAFKYDFKSAMLRALKYDGHCVIALADYGIFLKDGGEYDQSETYLRRAIDIGKQKVIPTDEDHPHSNYKNRPYLRALWHLSDLLLSLNRYSEAAVFINELHTIDKDDRYRSSDLLRRASMTT